MKFEIEDQLIISTFSPGFGGTSIPEWIKPWLENGLGSITLFGSNTPDLDSTFSLVSELRSYNPDLVIAIDEEGGDVTRLFAHEGSPFPTPALLGRCDDEALTFASYHSLGQLLKELDIDMTFAPVADVVAFHENPIVGVRSFGSSAELVSRHIAQAVRGIQSAGVGACLKHFPGHGPVREDSHHLLPRVTLPLSGYETGHVQPFISGIYAGASAVMIGHLVVDAIDPDNPASTSHEVITGYLRESMNYQGLIVTDALDMGALGGIPSIGQSALSALEAGANLLCFSGMADQSEFIERSLKHIKSAMRIGSIPQEHFESSLARTSNFKNNLSITPGFDGTFDPSSLGKGFEVTGSINLSNGIAHVVESTTTPTIAAGNVAWGILRFLQGKGIKCEIETFDSAKSISSEHQLVVAFKDAYRDPQLLNQLWSLRAVHPDAIFIDMGWPTREFNPTNMIRTYGSSAIASEIAAQLLTFELSKERI